MRKESRDLDSRITATLAVAFKINLATSSSESYMYLIPEYRIDDSYLQIVAGTEY